MCRAAERLARIADQTERLFAKEVLPAEIKK
jgi:hypothetical protein